MHTASSMLVFWLLWQWLAAQFVLHYCRNIVGKHSSVLLQPLLWPAAADWKHSMTLD
jgi:hypothetical protein